MLIWWYQTYVDIRQVMVVSDKYDDIRQVKVVLDMGEINHKI